MTLKTLETRSIHAIFDHLLAVVSGPRFLKKQGLGNEVPFFICPFDPAQAIEMERTRKQLVGKLGQRGVRVLELDLYDLAVGLLQARGIWERILEKEADFGKDELLELLQGVLAPEDHLVPAIAERIAQTEHDVIFLHGVGEVFPYIRSHNVLNNLQSVAKDRPTVLFFPGAYTHSLDAGASLTLFGRLEDDRYYRAFNIFHCEP